jgi:hypothetical protein
MTSNIPSRIVQNVVQLYFTTAKSMDWIAAKNGISKSSVFNIVQGKKGEDPDFSLMRHLTVNLDKSGLDVPCYAYAIRITRLFEEYAIDIETGEELIGKLLSSCYRHNWAPNAAISTLKRFENLAGEFNMTAPEFALTRRQDLEEYKNLHALVNEERKKLQDYRVRNTIECCNRVLLGGPTGLVTDGWTAINNAKLYREKYYNLLKDVQQNNTMHVDKNRLSELNNHLAVTEEKVLEMCEDIRRNPEKFWFLFDDEILAVKRDSAVATLSESTEHARSSPQIVDIQ